MMEEMAIAGVLTALVMAILALPMLRRRESAAPRAAYDLAVYQDQLAEVDRDGERGLISPAQAAAARAEIGRRMLAAGAELRPQPAAPRRYTRFGLAAVALLPVAAVPFYVEIGAPGAADRPFGAQVLNADAGTTAAGAPAAPHDMGDAVSKLAERLKQKPDDGAGWQLLARSYIAMGRMQDGVDAFRHVYDLSNQSPEVAADYGEALVAAADGTVNADAKQLFQAALKDPEGSLRARYYLALATLQAGDAKAALQSWVDLEHDLRADATWQPALRERITETAAKLGVDPATLKTSAGLARPVVAAEPPAPAASEPSPAAEATAPSGEITPEQQAMINSMVTQLAERLKQQPNDPDGWARLGRSYMVLEKPDQARDAYAQAAKLKPEDQNIKTAYAEAMIVAAATAGAPPPEPAVAVMRDLLKTDGQNAEALWYVGDAEAAAGHKDAALDLWRKLLAQLPADAPFRSTLETRIAALQGAK